MFTYSFGLFTPTTLAAMVADLQLADERAWIACDEERNMLDQAMAQLVALVGQDQVDAMIEEAS